MSVTTVNRTNNTATKHSEPVEETKPEGPPPPPPEADAPETNEAPPPKPPPGAADPLRNERLEPTASAIRSQADTQLEAGPTGEQLDAFIDSRVELNRELGQNKYRVENAKLEEIRAQNQNGVLTSGDAWQQIETLERDTNDQIQQSSDLELLQQEALQDLSLSDRVAGFLKGVGAQAVDLVSGVGNLAGDIVALSPGNIATKVVTHSAINLAEGEDLGTAFEQANKATRKDLGEAAERNWDRVEVVGNLAWNLGPGGAINTIHETAQIIGDAQNLASTDNLDAESLGEAFVRRHTENPTVQMSTAIGRGILNLDDPKGPAHPENIGRLSFDVAVALAPFRAKIGKNFLPRTTISPLPRAPVNAPKLPGQRSLPPASSPRNPGGWKTIDVDAVTVSSTGQPGVVPPSINTPILPAARITPNATALTKPVTGPSDGRFLHIQIGAYEKVSNPAFYERMGQAVANAEKTLANNMAHGPLAPGDLKNVADRIATTRRSIAMSVGDRGGIMKGTEVPNDDVAFELLQRPFERAGMPLPKYRNSIRMMDMISNHPGDRHAPFFERAQKFGEQLGANSDKHYLTVPGPDGNPLNIRLSEVGAGLDRGGVVHPPPAANQLLADDAFRIMTDVVNDPNITLEQAMPKLAEAQFKAMHGTPWMNGTPAIWRSLEQAVIRTKFGRELPPLKPGVSPFWEAMLAGVGEEGMNNFIEQYPRFYQTPR